MLARWIEKLGQFDYETKHEAGKNIPHADCLSRVPQNEGEELAEECYQLGELGKNMWSTSLGITPTQIEEHQKQSNELSVVRRWVSDKIRPDKRQMAGASNFLWKLWCEFQNLRIQDNLLIRKHY